MNIHPSSLISEEAELADDVAVGPFCVIEGKVRLGYGCILESHVRLGCKSGITELGKNNVISAGAVVGGPPQDLKYKGEPTKLILGDNNKIRECATLNIGTVGGGATTRVGDSNLFMAYSHVGHDTQIGNENVIANAVSIAGHVKIQDKVIIGGMCAINQFCILGSHSFIGGTAAINKDIAPFSMASGNYAVIRGVNKIGMERSGYTKEEISSAQKAIRILTKSGLRVEESIERIKQECEDTRSVKMILDFVSLSERGLAI